MVGLLRQLWVEDNGQDIAEYAVMLGVMLTKSGAKLLDFGLARRTLHTASLATLTAAEPQQPLTEEGMIVGAFQYMSPEQVEGKDVDARSDIFSLGAVLYEMVTGKRAFEGKSQLGVASAILENEPAPISTIKPMSPRSLDRVIRRCLAKEPDDRWQSARDLPLELKSISAEESLTAVSPNLHVDVVELKISFVAKDGHSENTRHRNPGATLESLGGLFLLKQNR